MKQTVNLNLFLALSFGLLGVFLKASFSFLLGILFFYSLYLILSAKLLWPEDLVSFLILLKNCYDDLPDERPGWVLAFEVSIFQGDNLFWFPSGSVIEKTHLLPFLT